MVEIENMNPESRIAGRYVVCNATWVASTWVFTAAEMNIPKQSAPNRKRNVSPESSRRLPRSGTSKITRPAMIASATSNNPIAT